MILASVLQDLDALAAVQGSARPGEEVVSDPLQLIPAALRGFPRVAVVWDERDPVLRVFRESGVPVVLLAGSAWTRNGASESPKAVMRALLDSASRTDGWIEWTFAEMSRASGGPVPPAFRAFSRRPLEYPCRYRYLHSVVRPLRLTPGALKQRFRRHGLPSPSRYLQWLHAFSAAAVLSDPHVSIAQGAHRLGFSSGGNLSRSLSRLVGLSTSELRSEGTRRELVVRFVSGYLRPDQRASWSELAALFWRAA